MVQALADQLFEFAQLVVTRLYDDGESNAIRRIYPI